MAELAPGIYPGLPMPAYLAMPAIGSGVIKAIAERCPAAAWHESYLNPHRASDPSKESDAGELAHAIVLEGSEDRVCAIDPCDYPAKSTGSIPDGWTNVAIRAARDQARVDGKIPVLLPQWAKIKAMADAARRFIDSLQKSEPAVWRAFQPDGGTSEVTAVWSELGTLCRMRSDRVANDWDVIADLKFVGRSAHPDAFARSGLLGMQYAMSAGWYRRGVRALKRVEASYVFVVIEQDPPHLCSLVGLDPEWVAYADAKVSRALRDWQACVERQHWPGYPTRAVYPPLPGWEAQRFGQQELEAPFGTPFSYEDLVGSREAA